MGYDVHSHWLPYEYIEMARAGEGGDEIKIVKNKEGKEMLEFGGEYGKEGRVYHRLPIQEQYYNWDLRFADWDKMGLEKVAVSIQPMSFHHNAPVDFAVKIHRFFNDELAKVQKKYSSRVVGLGSLPMADVDASVAELHRSMKELGLKGVQVGSNVQGVNLGNKKYWPIYEAAEKLGAFILIHPTDVAGVDRLGDYYFKNFIGNPLETTITAGSLIYSGVFEDFPNLKICLCHSGGLLPYVIGRFDHGWNVRAECKHLPKAPSSYLNKFYFDCISHSPEAFRFLAKLVGTKKLVIGTDYPLDMGLTDPIAAVKAAGFNEEETQDILYNNAEFLFK